MPANSWLVSHASCIGMCNSDEGMPAERFQVGIGISDCKRHNVVLCIQVRVFRSCCRRCHLHGFLVGFLMDVSVLVGGAENGTQIVHTSCGKIASP